MRLLPAMVMRVLPIVLVLVSLVFAPLSTALAVHHDLAHAEENGHQHSDHDVCVWIQAHSTGSLSLEAPAPQTLPVLTAQGVQSLEIVILNEPFPSSGSPRGPPLS